MELAKKIKTKEKAIVRMKEYFVTNAIDELKNFKGIEINTSNADEAVDAIYAYKTARNAVKDDNSDSTLKKRIDEYNEEYRVQPVRP